MSKKLKTLILIFLLLIAISLSECAPGNVSVGIGVYAPGAWVGPYGGYGGYYPPVGIGYPVY